MKHAMAYFWLVSIWLWILLVIVGAAMLFWFVLFNVLVTPGAFVFGRRLA